MNQQPKTVIITGANSGIGKAAAKKFASAGFNVIMTSRNPKAGEKALKEIIKSTGSDKVELMMLDTSSFDSIKQFCNEYKSKFQKVDVLIHNAAYFNHGADYQLSPDNIEITFATNVFGPYLITMLLKDLLARSDDARILNAGSNIIKHFFNPKKKINFENLYGEDKIRYSHSVYINYRNSLLSR
jgi:NAD(P)-dependent dehydrogenase (short-subunit alcohol dehydrogenase family)